MQKMIFLFEQETRSSDYQFQAANFGPFSWRLSSALDFLVSNGFTQESKRSFTDGAEKYEYTLTKDGVELVRDLLAKDSRYPRYLEIMNSLKEKYNGMVLAQLLRHIYSRYPDYAVKSQYEF